MCISPDAYVWAKVYRRLLDAGVDHKRADAVARKVAKRYALRRREAAVPTQTAPEILDAFRGT